jgi:hypothetical protein
MFKVRNDQVNDHLGVSSIGSWGGHKWHGREMHSLLGK